MDTSPLFQQLPPFDELVELAQKNPDAFVALKKEICEEMISAASEPMQARLWAQQSHIDLVVSRCKNPNHTNVVLMRELVTQMTKFQQALDTDTLLEPQQKAEVIPFDAWR